MKTKFFIQLYILKLLIKEIFSIYAYFYFQLIHATDIPKYIISSEGIIYPKNPNEVCYKNGRNIHYVYNFENIKHNLEKKICIYMLSCDILGYFNFDYVSINEYIITNIYYENWYCFDDCNLDANKNFISPDICGKNRYPLISYSNEGFKENYKFCLDPMNDISHFYINDNYINRNYYIGKAVEYFINNDIYNIPIKDLFSINSFDNLEIFSDTISLEISNIQNGKGKIFNGNEELSEGCFFNPNINLTFKNKINEGYLMIISIKTKPRNRPSSVSTCVNDAKIYLYISQENCTMDEASDNYCQQCIDEYGKNGNNCYHKSEKFTNLYYDEHSQTFKQCEINNIIYNCSICPKGSYIFENKSLSNICKKCPEWKYTNSTDQYECISCPPHCAECNTKGNCIKCNNNALNGLGNCSVCENKIEWEYIYY